MSTSPVREFPGSFIDVLVAADKIQSYLATTTSDFQSRFPTIFTDAYLADFANAITKAHAISSDEVMREYQVTHTAAIESIYTRFEPLYLSITIAAAVAFATDETVQTALGVGRKSAIIRKNDSLHQYLIDFPGLWAHYGQQLVNASCPPSTLAEMIALERDFTSLVTTQGSAMDERHGVMVERITSGNFLWNVMLQFETCAVAIYGKGSAKAEQFHLSRGGKSGAKPVVPVVSEK